METDEIRLSALAFQAANEGFDTGDMAGAIYRALVLIRDQVLAEVGPCYCCRDGGCQDGCRCDQVAPDLATK
jgi:hypothetical protein